MQREDESFSRNRKPELSGTLGSRVPDPKSQTRLMDRFRGPSQSGPVDRSQDPPASQDHVQTTAQRRTPRALAEH
jgi:hypothetical protein